MEHLFFNCDDGLEIAARRVFGALGLATLEQGDSLNVLGGAYVTVSILGTALKLEENCYDYEDEYNYMLGVKRDACGDIVVSDTTVGALARIVARVLADNTGLVVAMETEAGLDVIAQGEKGDD